MSAWQLTEIASLARIPFAPPEAYSSPLVRELIRRMSRENSLSCGGAKVRESFLARQKL
jgi:hypothetical protein